MPTLRQRRMLRDYATSRERLRKPDHRAVLTAYMRGVVVIGLVMLAAWLLWHISGGIVARLV